MGKKTKVGKGRLDKYYHLAKDQGYRARSAFKLIQLAKKTDFLSKARICIDLCAAPGGWSQVAQRNMPSGSLIIAVDLVAIKPMHGVTCIQSDITSDKCRSLLRKEMKNEKCDVVLHDGAPNVGANWAKDAFGQAELTLYATRTACEHLRPGGTYVTKVFRSADYNSLLWVFNQLFTKVDATKPTASRNVSAEIFVVCTGFKAQKIDPKFFEPKWVFMETLDPVKEEINSGKRPGASLSDYVKNAGKKHRGGYEDGDDYRVVPAHDFVNSKSPAEVLINGHKLNLDAPGSEDLAAHVLTTVEIRDSCADLKVCGKRDLSQLLKWRMLILRGRERAEKKAQKAAAAEEDESGGAAKAGGNKTIQQDVDDAISAFLDESLPGAKGMEAKKAAEDSDAGDEELEKDLAEQVDNRRREEKREAKRTMTRQKKQEWRKKMSLGNSKNNQSQDQPELFRVTDRSVQALEDEDKYIDPALRDKDSDATSDQADAGESDDSSDDELDRLAKLEVDLAVDHQLRKMQAEDKFRTQLQRTTKKKKETRRQRVLAAWSGELKTFNEMIDNQAADHMALREKDHEEGDDDDDDVDDSDLQALRDFQRQLKEAESGKKKGGLDAEALSALADGPGGPKARANVEDASEEGEDDDEEEEEEDEDEDDDGDGDGTKAALPAPSSKSTALVPLGGDALKAEHRANRWFSQDIFQNVGGDDDVECRVAKKTGRARDGSILPLDRDSDSEESDGSAGAMKEVDDKDLPKLPLTDKERRKLKRRKDKERNSQRGTQRGAESDDEEKGPLEVAPLEPPRSIVPQGPQKPTDPKELAETLALGSLMVESKKSRMQLIDAAYNRWSFDGDEGLPDWFTEEEEKYNKPELPITKELMDQFRAKLREINARPIRKVAEARARKGRRLKLRLDKIRGTAMGLSENGELDEFSKARQMRKMVSKMARSGEMRPVQVVAIKKGGGGKSDQMKAPKGAKVKVVDRRAKSDLKALRRSRKKNPDMHKKHAKKWCIKRSKGKFSTGKAGGGKKLSSGFTGDGA